MSRLKFAVIFLFVLMLFISACTRYESREVSFRPPAQYASFEVVAGAQVAAEGYSDSQKAEDVFGFDIRKAGLLPVQVVIENSGRNRLELVPEQTFLVDSTGGFWELLDRRTAYKRVESSSEFATILEGGAKKSFLGAAAGALVGLAIGVLDGGDIGNDIGRGAAVGAAGGALLGGVDAGTSGDQGRQIARDLANKQLDNRVVEPGTLGHGFLFFPGEAPDVSQLRLRLRNSDTGEEFTINLLP